MKRIKNYIVLLVVGLFAFCMESCKDEEKFTTFPQPGWSAEFNKDYNASMTAVVSLPDNLAAYANEKDEIAAFIGNECRGVGTAIEGLYYVLIKGSPEEQAKVTFRYYSATNQYMYKAAIGFDFEADGTYGTTDEPKILPLIVVEE